MYWIAERGTMLQGDYAGEYLDEVVDEDPTYLRWLLANVDELHVEERERIQDALDGRMV